VVPDGSGSRIEGRLGWRPAVRLTVVALVVSLALLWCGLLGYVGRSLFAGGPILQQASGLIVIPVILAALAGLIALCERLARPEAAHLRAWLTGRLDVPAPPPRTAPVPRPRRSGRPSRPDPSGGDLSVGTHKPRSQTLTRCPSGPADSTVECTGRRGSGREGGIGCASPACRSE
jgi:hypothetical protein